MYVLEGHGPALLERYPLQGLSWEQVKELKGPNLVGLGMGSGPAPGELACLGHNCSSLPAVCGCSWVLVAFMGPCPQAMHSHDQWPYNYLHACLLIYYALMHTFTHPLLISDL